MDNVISFSDEDKKTMKETLLKCINDLLPQIIKEITPLILKHSQDLLGYDACYDFKVGTNVDNDGVLMQGLKLIATRQNFWSVLLDTREDRFYKYTRDEMLLNLYREGLQETPVYVPCIFREDETNVNSQHKAEVNQEINTRRLEVEIDILEIRCKNLATELNSIDNKIKLEILNLSPSKKIIYAVMNDINQKIKRSNERINQQWALQIDKLRKIYVEDRKKQQEETKENGGVNVDIGNDHETLSSISTDVVPLTVLKDGNEDLLSMNENDRYNENWENEINRLRQSYKTKRNRYQEINWQRILNPSAEDYATINNKSDDLCVNKNIDIRSRYTETKSRYGNVRHSKDEDEDEDENFVDISRNDVAQAQNFQIKHPLRYSVLRRLQP